MTETNLKRCPFCGGEAKCIEFYGLYHVICCDCHAAGQDCSTRENAVSAWNTRQIEEDLDKKNGHLIDTCHDLHDIVEEFRAECDQKDFEIKRLREALEEIKKTVEDAQDTIYPFHLALDSKDGIYILEVTKEALKGDEE